MSLECWSAHLRVGEQVQGSRIIMDAGRVVLESQDIHCILDGQSFALKELPDELLKCLQDN